MASTDSNENNIEDKKATTIRKQKKAGKTFPVLIPMKPKPTSTTITENEKDSSSSPHAKKDDPPASSSDNEVSNIPLSQRLKSLNKKKKNNLTRFRLKQSKADRDILNATENPKPSTSGPLRREIERFRRALLAKAEGKSPPLSNPTPPFKRVTSRNRGRQVVSKTLGISPLKVSPLKIKRIGRSSVHTAPGGKKTPVPAARKKLKLLDNSNAKSNDTETHETDSNTNTAVNDDVEMAVSTLKLEQKEEDLVREEKTEDLKVESTEEVGPILSSNENSILHDIVESNQIQTSSADSVTETKIQSYKPSVIIERQEHIDKLAMLHLQSKMHEEIESGESDSESQSDSEVVSQISGQAGKSSCSNYCVNIPSGVNDKSSGKIWVQKKVMELISKKSFSLQLERLSSEATKSNGSSPSLVLTLDKKSCDQDQQNISNANKPNSRKRKISEDEDSSSDLEIDVVG